MDTLRVVVLLYPLKQLHHDFELDILRQLIRYHYSLIRCASVRPWYLPRLFLYL